MVNRTAPVEPFTLIHSNVDGAGTIGSYAELAIAKAEADRRQADSDAHGNPWGYRYSIYWNGRCLYRTGGGVMATTITPTLKRGARVRYVGIVRVPVPVGTEGLVVGQDRKRWIVDFLIDEKVERVTLHRTELKVIAAPAPDYDPFEGVVVVVSDPCACGHSGADHYVESLLSAHSCIRCECQMFEPAPPRFVATVVDGVPTVRDNQTGQVVSHKGVWTEAMAAEFAHDLELTPGTAHLLTWEDVA